MTESLTLTIDDWRLGIIFWNESHGVSIDAIDKASHAISGDSFDESSSSTTCNKKTELVRP